ncbi:MAG: zinc-ribbon domain-containing protein [Planctomycetota bacterium]
MTRRSGAVLLFVDTEATIAKTDETTRTEPVGRTCGRCGMEVPAAAEFCEHCGARIGTLQQVPWWHVHRRLYNWTLAWAYRPSSSVALFVLSFSASSFFPVPPDVLLMTLVLGNPRKWVRYAIICTVASVSGAVLGFCIGWLAWQGVQGIFFNYVPGFTPEVFDQACLMYEKYNFWIIFAAGFTPIPFKVATITAGVFGTGPEVVRPGLFFVWFAVAAVVSRSARFFLVAGLMRLFGPKITPFIEKYFNWLALLFTVLLVGGFVVLKYVV